MSKNTGSKFTFLLASHRIVLVLLVLGLLFGTTLPVTAASASALAVIEVTSNINSNTTWFSSNVYYIKQDISINLGYTLTIEPGTIIKFYAPSPLPSNLATLTVVGSLVVEPAPAQPVIFTSGRDDINGGDTNGDTYETFPAAGDWDAVIFPDLNNFTLSNINVLYSKFGLQIKNSTAGAIAPSLQGNRLEFNYCGITLTVGSSGGITSLVNQNTFISNEFGFCTSQVSVNNTGRMTPTLQDNIFQANRQLPLYLSGTSFPVYSGNTFQGYGTPLPGRWGLHLGIGLGGAIHSSGTWQFVGGQNNIVMPYVVVSPLDIRSTAEVTVNTGTVIKFYTHDEWPLLDEDELPALTVNGKLLLPNPGDPDHKVIFTSYHDDVGVDAAGTLIEGKVDTNGDGNSLDPTAGDWYQVYFPDNGDANTAQMIFQNLEFRYAVNGLYYKTTRGGNIVRRPEFRDIKFLGNVNGLRLTGINDFNNPSGHMEPLISDCIFRKNGRVPKNDTQVEHGVPIYLENTVHPTYINNTFEMNLNPAIGVAGYWRMNTTWVEVPGQEGMPPLWYIVHGKVNIGNENDPSGKDDSVTLTIPAQTIVLFNVNDYKASYKSYIVAAGAINILDAPDPSRPVVFTSIHDPQYHSPYSSDVKVPAKKDWQEVDVRNPASRFIDVVFRYSDKGLHIYNRGVYEHNPPITRVRFENNEQGLTLEVYKSGDISSVVQSCIFDGNSYGLVTRASNTSLGISKPVLINNTFRNHSMFPIYLAGSASPVYRNPATGLHTNIFANNVHRAIALSGYFGSDDDPIDLPRVPGDTNAPFNGKTFPYVVWLDTTFDKQTNTHIDGGLVFKFVDGKRIDFQGLLSMTTSPAQGNQNYFTSYQDDYYDNTDAAAQPTLSRTEWKGIYLSNEGITNFSYSTVKHSTYGLVIFQDSVLADYHMTISHNRYEEDNHGLSFWIESNFHIFAVVSDSVFQNNDYGLYTYSNPAKPHFGGSYPDLLRNQFISHKEFPIYLNGTANPNYHQNSSQEKNSFSSNLHKAIAVGGYWSQDATWTRVPGDADDNLRVFPYVVLADVIIEVRQTVPQLAYASITIPGKSLIKMKDDGRIYAYGKIILPANGDNAVTADRQVIFTSYKDDELYFNGEMGGNTNNATGTPKRNQWEAVWLIDFPGKYHEIHHTYSRYAEEAFIVFYAGDDPNVNIITDVRNAEMSDCMSGLAIVIGWWKDSSNVLWGGRGNIASTFENIKISNSDYGILTVAHNLSTGIARPVLTHVAFQNIKVYPLFLGGTSEPMINSLGLSSPVALNNAPVNTSEGASEESALTSEMELKGMEQLGNASTQQVSGLGDLQQGAPSETQAVEVSMLAFDPGQLGPAVALGGSWNNSVTLLQLQSVPYVVPGGFPATFKADDINYKPGDHLIVGETRPDSSSFATLGIPPGAIFKFSSGLKMDVKGPGNLAMQSTADRRIIFTSMKDDTAGGDTNRDGTATSPATGDWLGVILSSQKEHSEFHHAVLRYAAGGLHLYNDGDPFTVADTWVHHNTFLYNGNGITLTAQRSGDILAKLWENIFFMNGTHLWGKPTTVVGPLGGRLLVEAFRNSFSGNQSQKAIVNDNQNNLYINSGPGCDVDVLPIDRDCVFNARFNYWSDATGPYQSNLNPEGKGSSISTNIDGQPDNVLFEDYILPKAIFLPAITR